MIHSTTHTSSNLAGQEQVDIHRDMTLWEILKKAWLFKNFKFEKVTTDSWINLGGKKIANAFSRDQWVRYDDYYGLGIKKPATDEEMALITRVQLETALVQLAAKNTK